MELIPRNVFEPTVRFDVLRVVGIYVAASMITMEGRSKIFVLVSLRAETVGLLLDYTADEILASTTNGGLVWKAEG